LNAQGGRLATAEILSVMNILFERSTLVRAGTGGLKLLAEAQRKGLEDMEYLEQCLEQQPRTYNSKY